MVELNGFLERISNCVRGYHVSETHWDERNACVVQVLNAANAEDALLQLREVFPGLWSRRDAADLPPDIAQIVIGFGGFRSGQFIAASSALGGIRAWVWWAPWADDVTVSIRIGLLGAVTNSDRLALKGALIT